MSLNVKEWYLVEVYSRLVTALGANKAAETLIELREHLDESEREFTERGLSGNMATQAAMDRLGSPRQIALSFVNGRSQRATLLWTIGISFYAIATQVIERMNPSDPPTSLYYFGMFGLPVIIALITRRALHVGLLSLGLILMCGWRIWNMSDYVYVPNMDSMRYDHSHSVYKEIVADHHRFSAVESDTVSGWRKALANPKDGKVSFARLTYFSDNKEVGTPIYVGNHVVAVRYGMQSAEKFQYAPRVTGETIVKPLAEAQHDIAGRINEVHSRQKSRVGKIEGYRFGLNVSRLTRINQVAPWAIFGTLGMAIAAWLTSAGVAFLIASFRTRRRQLLA